MIKVDANKCLGCCLLLQCLSQPEYHSHGYAGKKEHSLEEVQRGV